MPAPVDDTDLLAEKPAGSVYEGNASWQSAWEQAHDTLKALVSTASYETWLRPLALERVVMPEALEKPLVVTLKTPSAFARSYLVNQFAEPLKTALSQAFGRQVQLRWQLDPSLAAGSEAAADSGGSEASQQLISGVAKAGARSEGVSTPPVPSLLQREHAMRYQQASQAPENRPWTPRAVKSNLNPRYSFEQLVVGPHNRFPHAAALAIAEQPASTYNPFFVYGPVGLGKTHLVQAIGHRVLREHPDLRVQYLTAEQFTNELIQAISQKQTTQFRDRYRNSADILILDDVQFLEGKERTQEELFHTFNSLYEAGKQLILTSDREPKALTSLASRLRSRFESGLIADIQPPDLETRVAILQLKAERDELEDKLPITLPLLQCIAQRFPVNVRELEGALNKVAAYAMLTNQELNEALVSQVLGAPLDRRRLDMDTVIHQVASYYKLKPGDLKGPNRSKEVSSARQVAIYLMRDVLETSFAKMGEALGGRKHATILYAYEKIKDLLERQPVYQQQLDEIKALLQR